MPLQYGEDYLEAMDAYACTMRSTPVPELHDCISRRARFESLFTGLLARVPDVLDVEVSVHQVTSLDGTVIDVTRFFQRESKSALPGPAIVHYHGSGMMFGSVAMVKPVLKDQVSQTGVQIFSVDYRLAPENKHPAPVEDSYAGLTWLSANADKFHVDPNRIAVMGESGGGGLAAGVALLARDRLLSPPLAKQILICPMLDDRNNRPIPCLVPLEDLATWRWHDNVTAWTALLGDSAGKKEVDVSPYAAPARVQVVQGLPPTYIDVGQLDIFCEESIEYMRRISAAGISTEFHLYPGVPHSFEAFAFDIHASKIAWANRSKAMTNF